MSLYDDASIILTPNAYKASKLYSLKPTDGTADFDVVRATTATRVNEDGLIESVGVNVPRLDYSGGVCPSILVEPLATNRNVDSNISVGVNLITSTETIIGVDGVFLAGKVIGNTSVVRHTLGVSNITVLTGDTITYSVYAKAGERNYFGIRENFQTGSVAIFDLINGTTNGVLNSTMISHTNGWWRCIATRQYTGAGATGQLMTFLTISSDGASSVYADDGTSGIYVMGQQVEGGSTATSYIPTTGSTVTRNADSISKTGIGSLINSEEGTLFFEGSSTLLIYNNAISLSNGSTSNNVYFYYDKVNSKYGFAGFVGGSLQFNIKSGIVDFSDNAKIACKYKLNDFALWVNGVEVDTDSSGITPSSGVFNKLSFNTGSGAAPFYGKVKQLQVYPTALTDTELTALTTL